jgi:transposase-like protein
MGHIMSRKALFVFAGVREEDGHRELSSARITDCENEVCWSAVSDDLKNVGCSVHRVKLIVTDGHQWF